MVGCWPAGNGNHVMPGLAAAAATWTLRPGLAM